MCNLIYKIHFGKEKNGVNVKKMGEEIEKIWRIYFDSGYYCEKIDH